METILNIINNLTGQEMTQTDLIAAITGAVAAIVVIALDKGYEKLKKAILKTPTKLDDALIEAIEVAVKKRMKK